jgi:hypothetical protein
MEKGNENFENYRYEKGTVHSPLMNIIICKQNNNLQ